MKLDRYKKMRKFSRTPEPSGTEEKGRGALRFVVQLHHASRTHYDFRLEMDGVMKSWAVPKGPSLDPLERRLAVMTEDHPIEYGSFEGVIPKGNYGAGTVMIWDEGTYVSRETEDREEGEANLLKSLAKGHITFILHGKKLHGEFALIKLAKGEENAWLLVKKHDQFVSRQEITYEDRSAVTGRTMGEIARQSEETKTFWTAKGRYDASAEEIEKPSKAKQKKILKVPTAMAAKKMEALLKSAPKEDLPLRFKPQKTNLGKAPFDRADWIFEPAWDGYRAIAVASDRRASQIFSKTGVAFKGKFANIVAALDALENTVVIDGFIVAVDENGAPRRKGALGGEGTSSYIFFAIDILHFAGRDLRHFTLQERKAVLAAILKSADASIKLNPCADEVGRAVFNELLDEQCKSLLARDGKAIYNQEKNGEDWLTISLHRGADSLGDSGNTPTLTNLNKIYWPEERYTKGDLINYYREIAPLMLPYLIDRPQSLHRHPNGIENEGFFQKEMAGNMPRWAKTVSVTSSNDAGSITYALCQDEATLLYLANLGCIEINPWNSRVATLENPDYVVIDLDPTEAPFKAVIEVAQLVRKLLDDIGAPSFCKTSGGRGLHIYVPLAPIYSYEEVRLFAELLANVVNKLLPAITSVERMPARRRGRVYLDFLQNRRGATTAAIYAVRPRPKAPVSTPITWDEINRDLDPSVFTMKTVIQRIAKRGDLWEGFFNTSADLKDCHERLAALLAK